MPTRPDTAVPFVRIRNHTRTGAHLSFRSALSILAACYERYRQRRDLADLDDRLLEDIGVTRQEASRETGQPFWRTGR